MDGMFCMNGTTCVPKSVLHYSVLVLIFNGTIAYMKCNQVQLNSTISEQVRHPTPEKQIFLRKKGPQAGFKPRTPTTIPERTHALDR